MQSSSGFSSTLELWPADIEWRAVALLIVLLGVCGVLAADLAPAIQGAATAALLAFLPGRAMLWRRPGRNGLDRVIAANGGWRIFYRGAPSPCEADLESAWGIRHGPVIGLLWRVRESGRREWLWVTRRTVSAATWRRLRVRLQLS